MLISLWFHISLLIGKLYSAEGAASEYGTRAMALYRVVHACVRTHVCAHTCVPTCMPTSTHPCALL